MFPMGLMLLMVMVVAVAAFLRQRMMGPLQGDDDGTRT